MRTLKVQLSGEPTVGDCVMIHWCARGGGRTTAGHYVKDGETMDNVLSGLVESAKVYLLSESEMKRRDDGITIQTSRDDGEWIGEVLGVLVEGGGRSEPTEKVEITELA